MRIFDIISEDNGTDTWEKRFAAHQRREGKRLKARAKVADAQSRAAEQNRIAAAKRTRANDRITAARRDLSRT